MTPPLDTPTAFEIKRVEHKKDGTTKDGKAFTILNLGLLAPDGEKVWPAEFFAIGDDPSTWPSEGSTSTFVLSQPDNPEWALKASHPRRGGGQSNAAKEAYWDRKEQRDIEGTRRMGRAHAQEMALRYLALLCEFGEEGRSMTIGEVQKLIDWFQKDVDSA